MLQLSRGDGCNVLPTAVPTDFQVQRFDATTIYRGIGDEVGIPRREADKVHEGQLLQGLELVGGTHHKVCDKVGLGAGGSTAKRHQDRRRRQKSTLHADDVG